MQRRLLTEFGMGTSLRQQDYTQAAVRGVENALWHNSINLAELFGKEKAEMKITVDVGVQQPERVDVAVVESEKVKLERSGSIPVGDVSPLMSWSLHGSDR